MHDMAYTSEKSTESAFDAHNDEPEDVPDYDDLLESALDSVDVYQARRADMNKHLKTAFFNLAQAKQALGPARVGPASYHLGRIEPLLTVNIVMSVTGEPTYELAETRPALRKDNETGKGKGKAASGGIVDLRLHASTSALKLEDSAGEKATEPSKMRRRVQKFFSKEEDTGLRQSKAEQSLAHEALETPLTSRPASSVDEASEKGTQEADDLPPTYSETFNEYLLDPMQQFSAFPPVTLRKAQTEFRHSLRVAMKLLQGQRAFDATSKIAMVVDSKSKPGAASL